MVAGRTVEAVSAGGVRRRYGGVAKEPLRKSHPVRVPEQSDRIFFAGETLPQFVGLIGIELVFVLCLTIGPMLFFACQLIDTKRMGLRRPDAVLALH